MPSIGIRFRNMSYLATALHSTLNRNFRVIDLLQSFISYFGKPLLEWLCILGWYRLDYPENCFSVNRICFTHLPIRGRQFQLSDICGQLKLPSFSTSCLFRSKPALDCICLRGWYRLDYPEECFGVYCICSTHISVSSRHFQLSYSRGQLRNSFCVNELLL